VGVDEAHQELIDVAVVITALTLVEVESLTNVVVLGPYIGVANAVILSVAKVTGEEAGVV
jgi:hypothetical protein